jgi:hypothetical protein
MANLYDIIYRGKDAPANYKHDGEKWSYYGFERRGEEEADAKVNDLIAQGFEAKRVSIGKTRSRDIDD